VIIEREDGERRWVSANSAPVRDSQGNIVAGVVVFTDITEHKRAEEQREELESQLRQAQKMEAVGQLAGGVAHDFNNILTAIFGNVELAISELETFLPDESRSLEGLRQIEQSAERAAALTRQLLAFSRRQVTQPELLDLNTTLSNLQKMLRRLITENVALKVINGKDLEYALADPGQIEQVIVNLSVNARDAMPEGGTLTIETANVTLDEAYAAHHPEANPGPHVMLAVSDTGHGIDPATRERIFEPFFTTKRLGEGTGLGLATVYGVVKQASGHIMVYSEVGRGTTFRIYLPVAQVADMKRATPVAERPPPTGTETVLVCEDDPAVRDLTANMLHSAGYTVLSASGASQAVELAKAETRPIDLLITDVIMPDTNGKALSAILTSLRPDLRTLYVSGYTANVIAHHGVLDEGVAFLEKPFSRDKLLRRVRQVLDAVPSEHVDEAR
jgi:signal transduction histidine kinase/CheY-like chemotaxis protein